MKLRLLLFVIIILGLVSLFLTGCAGHPEGLDSPRVLTDVEKGMAVEVALDTPEAQKWLEQRVPYTTELNWLAIEWDGSDWTAYHHIDADWRTDPNLKNVPDSAVFYPYVSVRFMEPADCQVTIAVDLNKEKPVLVHEYPAQKGPVQTTPDSVEIRPAPIHEVQVNIAESYPPQVMVYIEGGLSDGCTTFNEVNTERKGSTIYITVTTQRPVDAICTQVYGYFEKNVNLGADFISGESYTIYVNKISTVFMMQ